MGSNMRTKPEHRWPIISAVMIVAGAWTILLPPETSEGFSTFLGSLLILVAATDLGYAWHTRDGGRDWSRRLLISLGSALVIAGGYVLLHPQASSALLTFVFLIYLVGDSILQFVMGYKLSRSSESGWLRFEGISNSIIFGIMLVVLWTTWPATSRQVLGVLGGMSMLFTGVARLMFCIAPPRTLKGTLEEYHEIP